jgi:hypothetical protein
MENFEKCKAATPEFFRAILLKIVLHLCHFGKLDFKQKWTEMQSVSAPERFKKLRQLFNESNTRCSRFQTQLWNASLPY